MLLGACACCCWIHSRQSRLEATPPQPSNRVDTDLCISSEGKHFTRTFTYVEDGIQIRSRQRQGRVGSTRIFFSFLLVTPPQGTQKDHPISWTCTPRKHQIRATTTCNSKDFHPLPISLPSLRIDSKVRNYRVNHEADRQTHSHTHTYIYIYIYIHTYTNTHIHKHTYIY